MQKWEYRVEEISSGFFSGPPLEEIQARLNKLGLEGWELAASNLNEAQTTTLYLKRQLP